MEAKCWCAAVVGIEGGGNPRISLIMHGSDMRATPPSALMSAGIRSRAMTGKGASVTLCVKRGRNDLRRLQHQPRPNL